MPPARADADLDPAAAQLVQCAQALGQVDRAVQRGDEHDAAQAYPLGAGGRVGHRLDRAQGGHRAERLLQRPGAVEAKLLGPRQVGAEAGRIERAVSNELRDGDRKSHDVSFDSDRVLVTFTQLSNRVLKRLSPLTPFTLFYTASMELLGTRRSPTCRSPRTTGNVRKPVMVRAFWLVSRPALKETATQRSRSHLSAPREGRGFQEGSTLPSFRRNPSLGCGGMKGGEKPTGP